MINLVKIKMAAKYPITVKQNKLPKMKAVFGDMQ